MFDTMNGDQSANLTRLCDLYDVLLTAPDTDLVPEAEQELRAMAKIFDLDAEGALSKIWAQLRSVLVKQLPITKDDPQFEPLTLLLVEDDVLSATDLTEALDDAGHRVVGPFHSAEAAQAAAALHDFDAALLDINLSGEQTGVELAKVLKSRWGTPIIFLSGDVTAAAQNADLADAMVMKPYRGRDIVGALNRIRA